MSSTRSRVGLRTRVTIAFALGALILSAVLSLLTYELTRTYLLRQRESSADHQAQANARLVQTRLQGPLSNIEGLLTSLETQSGSSSLVEQYGAWHSSSRAVNQYTLPHSLRETVGRGQTAYTTFSTPSGTAIAVGVPLPSVGAQYFEIFNLVELRHTLRTLELTLVAAAAITTLAGAITGRWATRRVLRPVAEIASAAADIASGHLDVRLPGNPDVDLAVLTESFNTMVASLQTRIERDARFASDVSHELRSPLTTIATSLDVLQRHQDQLEERPRRALTLLTADLERFQRLVQDLIEMSRSDAGVVDMSLEPVRIAELVRRVAGSSAPTVPLTIEPTALDTIVLADKRRLERAIANIIDNANAHAGGATGITIQRAGDRLRIVVEDRGPGVPVEARDRIFDRFARGPNANRQGGSSGVGLGLALVADHLRLHHGRVWVEGRSGGGARFVLDLPVAAEAAGNDAEGDASASLLGGLS